VHQPVTVADLGALWARSEQQEALGAMHSQRGARRQAITALNRVRAQGQRRAGC
jgi:hypothetical protein